MTVVAVSDPDRQPDVFCQAEQAVNPLVPLAHRHTCRKFYRHTGDHRCADDSMRWAERS